MRDLHSSPTESTERADAMRDALVDRIETALRPATNGTDRIVRCSVPASDALDPLAWMRAQQRGEGAYWSARDEDVAAACVGAADVVADTESAVDVETFHSQMEGRLRSAEGRARYYGGLRFDAWHGQAADVSSQWAPFGTYRFVLPRFELRRSPEGTTLTCNLVCPRDYERREEIVHSVRALTFPSYEVPADILSPRDRTDVPGRSRWTDMVYWALDAIADTALEKVVLARRVTLEFGAVADPFQILRHLQKATPGCFHFAVQPDPSHAFIGASPERLFRRKKNCVLSEAVAGTRARGDTEEADAALRQELMESPKERREHAFVQRAIRSALEELCASVEGPETPSDLALARGRHLHAPLRGTLHSSASTADLLRTLHPTPAVGGVPSAEARAAIRQQEPFDRGWYAGPVGWMGREEAEFAVAIRSGLVHASELALYSGAGLVEGSVPEREWDEIEQKIGDFAAILGIENTSLASG